MKILAISQVYWPDTSSVSQHLTDLLEALARKGHEVEILTSKNDYEDHKKKYKKYEVFADVKIYRLSNTSFEKKNKIGRLINFSSFIFLIFIKMLFVKKKSFDVVIGLTVPPLLSYIGLKIALIKRIKFVYWAMDLQPELSIVAGYVTHKSHAAKVLQKRGDFIFAHSDKIIALDRYMKEHIEKRIEVKNEIKIIPVWPVLDDVYNGIRLENPFRLANGFGDRIVIMYSGNHSVMHPLDTLLEAAKKLKYDNRFLFVHIGGGIRLKDVIEFKIAHKLQNIITLPYQPRNKIHLSLGSADIQVVVLGENCVGYTHPNKIYGAMFIGKPILYIGPEHSHISDILKDCPGNICINHGNIEKLIESLMTFANLTAEEKLIIGDLNRKVAQRLYSPTKLIDSMISEIESV